MPYNFYRKKSLFLDCIPFDVLAYACFKPARLTLALVQFVPLVLESILRSSWKVGSDYRPMCSTQLYVSQKAFIFLLSPRSFLHPRSKVIHVPVAALPPRSPWKKACNQIPLALEAVFLNHLSKSGIFSRRKGPTFGRGISRELIFTIAIATNSKLHINIYFGCRHVIKRRKIRSQASSTQTSSSPNPEKPLFHFFPV